MGLFFARVRFVGEPPPSDEIVAALAKRIGHRLTARSLEPIERDGHELKVATLLDPVTYPYLMQLLSERGGVLLNHFTGEPRPLDLPWYVAAPWLSYPIATRAWIRLVFFVGLATGRRS